MKKAGWLILAAALIPVVAYLSYNAGYVVGVDLALTENKAEEAE
ncbi:MAG: hypothetical protein AAFR32_07380 [Pseudomonadota bacterium]